MSHSIMQWVNGESTMILLNNDLVEAIDRESEYMIHLNGCNEAPVHKMHAI